MPFLKVTAAAYFSILTTFTMATGGGISFPKERIDALIRSPDTLEIQGIYWFVNADKSPVSTAIYYPFPIDSFGAYPHFISLTRLADKRPMHFDTLPEGIQWTQSLAGGATDSIRVVYCQRIRHQQGRYIVTTAKLWGRPLKRADFSVTVPPKILLDFWSYPCDSVGSKSDSLTYHCHYAPFSPDADMLMRWRSK